MSLCNSIVLPSEAVVLPSYLVNAIADICSSDFIGDKFLEVEASSFEAYLIYCVIRDMSKIEDLKCENQ